MKMKRSKDASGADSHELPKALPEAGIGIAVRGADFTFSREELCLLFGVTPAGLLALEQRLGLREWTLEMICREWSHRLSHP